MSKALGFLSVFRRQLSLAEISEIISVTKRKPNEVRQDGLFVRNQ